MHCKIGQMCFIKSFDRLYMEISKEYDVWLGMFDYGAVDAIIVLKVYVCKLLQHEKNIWNIIIF